MADFTHVSVALDADGSSVDLSGQATTQESEAVTISTVVKAVKDGSTKTYESEGSELVAVPGETVIESVTDTAGHTYTVSADGQRATH